MWGQQFFRSVGTCLLNYAASRSLCWNSDDYKFLKWYIISDLERILGIEMSMSSLWFIVRLCPYLYKQSMEGACWLILDRSWKEGLRKTIADLGANGERYVYNDDNFRERVLTGLYRRMSPCLCCKVACWGGTESIRNDRMSSFVISPWHLFSSDVQ